MSLPSRERGLKSRRSGAATCAAVSLPSRERGLKFVPMEDSAGRLVAPFAGAWIEIISSRPLTATGTSVAPFAGAWIEIPTTAGRRTA